MIKTMRVLRWHFSVGDILILFWLMLTGCPKPPPLGPVPPAALGQIPTCTVDGGVQVSMQDICGTFTSEPDGLYACVHCVGAFGCVSSLKDGRLYCVVGSCQLDDITAGGRCRTIPGDSSRMKR